MCKIFRKETKYPNGVRDRYTLEIIFLVGKNI